MYFEIHCNYLENEIIKFGERMVLTFKLVNYLLRPNGLFTFCYPQIYNSVKCFNPCPTGIDCKLI